MNRPHGDGPDKPPFVLLEKERGTLRLMAIDEAALRSGLRVGMPLTEARAILPHIETADADPLADADYLRACASACQMFTPLIAIRGTDGLILDITGCVHLFGTEAGLLARVQRRALGLGLGTRAALAGTPDAAWAFARFGEKASTLPQDEQARARALPITALEQPPEITLALSRSGLTTLGDLTERPSHLLTARFGAELVSVLHRILGREDIRITPFRVMPEIMSEQHFAEPLTLIDSLMLPLGKLARNVAALLEQRAMGGRVFEINFFRSDGAVRRLGIETAQGLRDVESLMRLIRLKLDALADPLDPGFGFDAIRLAVLRSEPLDARQGVMDGGPWHGEAEGKTAALVDRLVARFGREHVRRFIAHETHDPVRVGRAVPCLSGHVSASWPEPEPGQPPQRPLTLFDQPQPIEALAEVPDGPPLRFRWRRVLYDVACAEGPERIAPEWWREGDYEAVTRDYYRVENSRGHRFWIFREGLYEDSNVRPRWFLHGLFA